jgi:hypothetical protein
MNNPQKEQKKAFKWWWGWNPGRIETWLEEEEANGWHLTHISPLGLNFTFQRGEPRKMAYCIDYQPQDKADYHQLYSDAGWSLINMGLGWYYWGQAYSLIKPVIFSDTDSLIERNRRQIWLLSFISLVQLPGLLNVLRVTAQEPKPFYSIAAIIQGGVFLMLVGVLIKFLISNHKLKQLPR